MRPAFGGALGFLFIIIKTATAGLLSPQGVAVLDSGQLARPSFTNSEKIVFQQRVFNGVASTNRIVYRFIVTAPSGASVFDHNGNAVPGTVGNSATQISGVPIAQFYTGPGVYTLRAQASLDAQTVEQTAVFTVSSPNILLVYPPNGAQGIAEVPLTFRWTSSGSTRYRVSVGDNPSFYNSVFNQETNGESYLSYPENPTDFRARLVTGQMYYWKVEGLDAGGLKVAESQSPYAFSVQSAALTRDLAVTSLAAQGPVPGAEGALAFAATVVNQGGTTENNVPLKFSIGGVAALESPVAITTLSPSESRSFRFSVTPPADQAQSLAIACVEYSDNDLRNNCKTLLVTRPAVAGGPVFGGGRRLSADQIWQSIRELLRDRGMAEELSGYKLDGMEGEMTADELNALLESLKKGQAQVSLTGPPPLPKPVVSAPAPAPKPGAPAAPGAPAPGEAGFLEPEDTAGLGSEWSGYSQAVSDKADTMVINNPAGWKKAWKQLRDGSAPDVNFGKYLVVGVIVGRSDRADRVEIESVQMRLTGMLVRYKFVVQERMLDPQRASLRRSVHYHLKVIPKTAMPLLFERVREEEEQGAQEPGATRRRKGERT